MVSVKNMDNLVELDINGIKLIITKEDAVDLQKSLKDVCITKWYSFKNPEIDYIKKSVRQKNMTYHIFGKSL